MWIWIAPNRRPRISARGHTRALGNEGEMWRDGGANAAECRDGGVVARLGQGGERERGREWQRKGRRHGTGSAGGGLGSVQMDGFRAR